MVAPNPKDDNIAVFGILSFEAAATMSRLISLQRALSDAEISHLRSDTMRSQGIAYLNSTDQSLLLRLACAEFIEDLDRIAEVISRFSRRCRQALPVGFDRLYTDLKSGSVDPSRLGLKFAGKSIEMRVRNMNKYVSTTAKLYQEMELLNTMEATERMKSSPINVQLEIKAQQRKIQKLKVDSLWSQSLDKAVEVMALAAYSTLARICVVFGPFVPGLPHIVVNKETSRMGFAAPYLKFRVHPQSGPLERTSVKEAPIIRSSCPIPRTKDGNNGRLEWRQMLQHPPPRTVGGSGLAMQYANVILQAEKVMSDGETGKRKELYGRLPSALKQAVRAKLREGWRDRGRADKDLAKGWKDSVRRIMGWLGPVAHDTVRWQAERTLDCRQRFESQPRALMLQTLHFSDREKTEAAIAEVLVGLSLVCWFEEPQLEIQLD